MIKGVNGGALYVPPYFMGYGMLLYAIYEAAIDDIKRSCKANDLYTALKLLHDDPYGFFTDENVHDGVVKKCYDILNERGFSYVIRRFTING